VIVAIRAEPASPIRHWPARLLPALARWPRRALTLLRAMLGALR
jgi:hypothetical protein